MAKSGSVKLIIDYRERDLITLLKVSLGEQYETANLDAGDIHLIMDGVIRVVIERKTVSDLSASIKDGRYREQKCRLKCMQDDGARIVYLIEGSLKTLGSGSGSGKAYKATETSLTSMAIRDGFAILYSTNTKNTADILYKMVEKFPTYAKSMCGVRGRGAGEGCEKGVAGGAVTPSTTDDYAKTIKVKKKANITHDVCFVMQLSQIPGVSTGIARCISGKYRTMARMIRKLLPHTDGGKQILNDMTFEIADGSKTRKIGPVISQRVVEFLGLAK